ncbi:uncharacterized protein NFIA_073450 [Aspergillus fischeri NRRL 181]|uniref:Uncharacterized protein n=1 Tax=Neosartorya fischeri (strain ATCC 1020 / DSM 3700 / CBS 544.65 / FGSC A1164 / JCM 1740 / NRRL 181 / WB 181) TaxID=331117 RepID=A1DDH2_NEOFI|nr:conserved hypothetical protein [Aspergillus fischeri NRRL 181]EAW17429.1 conserved hypothetical protein [Aspergillus fischeri NRRL 181]
MDDKEEISSLVSDLSDLEVALLLSLAVHEHCLIETTNDCIHDVAKELALLSTHHINTESRDRTRSPGFRNVFGDKKVVDVVIAKNFNYVDGVIQLHALEVGFLDHQDDALLNHRQLMRSKRLNTNHGPIEAPPGFLFVSLVVRDSDQLSPRLNHHLLLDLIQQLSTSVSVGADIIRYQQDIVVFLRLSRAVAGGITARSNMQFTKLSKYVQLICFPKECT